ncbi:hypothetical protein HOG98_10095 [bacterium]|jgi:hypothetical protein|nr:hypothetical protein [bacterium]
MKNIFNHNNKSNLMTLVVVLAASSLLYKALNSSGGFNLGHSSLLFVGLPTFITLLMIKFSKTPKTAYETVFKTITYFLLVSSIFLGEGLVCILMSAPIFYGVSALVVFIYNWITKKNKSKLFSILLIPAIITIGQPFGDISPEIQSVQTSVTFNKNLSLNSFNTQQKLQKNYPLFFKIGFPTPVAIIGTGIKFGDTRDIQFNSTTKGLGILSLKIIEQDKTRIKFKAIKDTTHISGWLTWSNIDVQLVDIGENQTKVIWVSNFTCNLGPKWYFEPLEKYAVGLMNQYLINNYFG